MNELLPLAALIRQRSESPSQGELLTFVSHDASGAYRTVDRSYRSLWSRGQAMARALAQHGVGAGDRFALMMQNHAEFVDAMVASSILGTVFVPIDPRTRGKKLQYMLDFSGCKGVLAGEYCVEQLGELAGDAPRLEWIWLVGEPNRDRELPGLGRWLQDVLAGVGADAGGRELAIHPAGLDEPMQMMFTSGTTGDPKGILSTYRRFASVGSTVGSLFGIEPGDRMYTGLSLTHANAQLLSLGASLYGGIPLVLSQKFSKSRVWDVIRDFRCTTLNLLGGMFTGIYSEPPTPSDADNPLRLIIGAGMPKELWEPFSRRYGTAILEFYGAAEGGMLINPPGAGPIGSVGKPPANLVARILDEQDQECPPFVPGEIVFENADGSPFVVEYFRNREASEKKTRGGLLRMGDIGYRDDRGWFYFMHRKGNEIRRNGDFISPGFVEKEIAEHPNVTDVFVFGVPGASGVPGEKDIVAALTVLDRREWDASDVFAHCERRLERNCVPSFLLLVDEIPKTASEKPLERVLLENFDRSGANVFARKAG